MRFGTEFMLSRGSNALAMNLREVRVRYIGARGNQILIVLIEDDPLAKVGPFLAGETGWYGRPKEWSDR
jgi:hypothetical protein